MSTPQSCPLWRNRLTQVKQLHREYAALVEQSFIDGTAAVLAAETKRLELHVLLEDLKTEINTYHQWWAPDHVPFVEAKQNYQQVKDIEFEKIAPQVRPHILPDGRILLGALRNGFIVLHSQLDDWTTNLAGGQGPAISVQGLPGDRVIVAHHAPNAYEYYLFNQRNRSRIGRYSVPVSALRSAHQTEQGELLVQTANQLRVYDRAQQLSDTLEDRTQHLHEITHEDILRQHRLPGGRIVVETEDEVIIIDPTERRCLTRHELYSECQATFPVSELKMYHLQIQSLPQADDQIRSFEVVVMTRQSVDDDVWVYENIGSLKIGTDFTPLIRSFQVLPDGRLITIMASHLEAAGEARLWRVIPGTLDWQSETLQPVITGSGMQVVYNAQVLPDGRIIITSTNGITVWDGDPV